MTSSEEEQKKVQQFSQLKTHYKNKQKQIILLHHDKKYDFPGIIKTQWGNSYAEKLQEGIQIVHYRRVGKVRNSDLKSQSKPDEIGLTMERGTSVKTTMKEEADHHEQMIKSMKLYVGCPSKDRVCLGPVNHSSFQWGKKTA